MKNFKFGREFQQLESRIESLETHFNGHNGHNGNERYQHAGVSVATDLAAGVPTHSKPQHWRAEKAMQLPPLFYQVLGLHDRSMQFDIMPESKTWTCQPEPLILYVIWNDGRTDEFYRLQNQTFSIMKITDPNTGHIDCTATYAARLVASGKAKSHHFPAQFQGVNGSQVNSPDYYPLSVFNITLRNAGQAPLYYFSSRGYYINTCQDNYDFVVSTQFTAGLYDLVAGATWEITGVQTVDHC
jgi:hypothetical protein